MEAEAGAASVSAAGMLRALVAEQLTRAAQEIFSVVESTVVRYEEEAAGLREEAAGLREEAAGLREEVARQRRLLEALLQPVVKLEAPDGQFPVSEAAAGLPEEEEQQKCEPGEEHQLGAEAAEAAEAADEEDKAEEEERLSHADAEASPRPPPSVQPDGGSEALTPQEVHGAAGGSAPCVRLQPAGGPTASAEFPPPVTEDAPPAAPGPSRPNTRAGGRSSRRSAINSSAPAAAASAEVLLRPGRSGRRSSRCLSERPRKRILLKVRILEDHRLDLLSTSVFQKYPLQELRCPRDLQEDDFLQLLRSSFPQLDAHKPFEMFRTDWSRLLDPLRVEALTPREIHRAAGRSALYIRLKEEEDPRAVDPSEGSPSTSEAATPNTRRLSAPEDEGGAENRLRARRTAVKLPDADADAAAPLRCKACWVRLKTRAAMFKHAWSHVDDPRRLCGVCGGQWEELRAHLQQHRRTRSCGVCGKNFLSRGGLKQHVARHADRTPPALPDRRQAAALPDHQQADANAALHTCDFCQKAFASKSSLVCHRLSHTGRRAALRCETCGRMFRSRSGLQVHRQTHGGNRALAGGNQTLASGNRTLAGGNRTLAGGNRTLAGGNRMLAGGNQTLAGGNRMLAGAKRGRRLLQRTRLPSRRRSVQRHVATPHAER